MHSKKTKEILANYRGARADKEEFESMMEDIIDKHLSVKNPAALVADESLPKVVIQQHTPASSPVSSPPSSPVSSPLQIEPTLDATHTASERSVYSVMYRLTISQGKTECYITNAELRSRTGIGSHNTVREAIKGLLAKGSIEKCGGSDCSHFGYRYRVYKPREIMSRRRQIGIEIDLASKKICSSPASSPGSSPKTGRGSSPKIGDEARSLLLKDLNHENHDDDQHNYPRKIDLSILRTALQTAIPTEGENNINQTIEMMMQHFCTQIANQIPIWTQRAKTTPATSNYFLTCLKNEYRSIESIETKQQTANKSVPKKDFKQKISALAAQIRNLHVGDNAYTLADFSADLKDACARAGITYTTELINEVIERK